MKLRPLLGVVAGALALSAPAWGTEAGNNVALAVPQIRVDAAPIIAAPSVAAVASNVVSDLAPSLATHVVVLESMRWRPRYWHEPEHYQHGHTNDGPIGFSQIHGGFSDPDGEPHPGFLAGARASMGPDAHVQFGLGADWIHRHERETALIAEAPLPGGGTTQRRQELSRSSSELFPLQAFVQIAPGAPNTVTPYFGVGGGYEWLLVSAENFQTGDKFDASYGGWGWQAWAGIAIPLSSHSRLSTELYRNQCTVSRDISDNTSNLVYREEVPLDGFGMRMGIGWGF